MNVTLERFCYSNDGTFGYLTLPTGDELCTVERPWLGNRQSISCIPVGKYKCKPRRYHRGGYDAIEICDVPNRQYILFHIGNYVRNVKGCIGVNSEHGAKGQEWCGVRSKLAFDRLMSVVGGQHFNLSITNRVGGEL